MAKESSSTLLGTPSFEYNPADERFPTLFNLVISTEELEKQILKTFAGRTLTMEQVYEEHNVGTRFIEKNYKDALKNLEASGKIIADPPAHKRKKGSFADKVKVTFPLIGE